MTANDGICALDRWRPSGLFFGPMKKLFPLLFLVAGLHAGEPVSLFDGKTFNGWTGQDGKAPGAGWSIVDGVMLLDGKGGNLI